MERRIPSLRKPALDPPLPARRAGKSRNALNQWQELDLEGRQGEWDKQLEQLKRQQAEPGAKPQWQQRAQDAEYQLLQLLSVLTALPDPAPHMQASAALPQRIAGEQRLPPRLPLPTPRACAPGRGLACAAAASPRPPSCTLAPAAHPAPSPPPTPCPALPAAPELEASNTALQADAKRAAEDTAEVQALVDKFRQLEADHKALQVGGSAGAQQGAAALAGMPRGAGPP
jgi:hypothetical protein